MNAVVSRLVATAHKKIKVRSIDPTTLHSIEAKLTVHPVTARVLAARNFRPGATLDVFLQPTLKQGLPNAEQLVGLREAAALTAAVFERKEKIALACDFDVDGLSGGAQAYHFLKRIGAAVSIFVPDRFKEGYGLNEAMIRRMHEEGNTLLITIDYGTTNIKEIDLARSLGMQTIVIDHHHVAASHATPDVFINPNQPSCGFADKILCAAGLVWYFLNGLKKAIPEAATIDLKEYLDLACLGTICDMVPLTGVNRVIAKKGLEVLTTTKRLGLISLKNVAGIKSTVNCHDVGFGIGPRINAAGRMVHGEVVIDLLTTDQTDRAEKLAGKLNRLNSDRQDTELLVKDQAIKMIQKRGVLEAGLVVFHKDFHTGVVGIVAQRLVENFYRPAVVMGVDSDGLYKGSVRGIKGFNVVEALHAIAPTMVKFGGHSGAGGLSVLPEKLPEFVEQFKAECERRLQELEVIPYIEADTEVILDELDFSLIDELQGFAPFGMGNPTPVLLAKHLRVLEVAVIKQAHTKAVFSDGTRHMTGMFWRNTGHPALVTGAEVNVAFKLDKSTFNGRTDLQATIQAIETAS
jgi:single-stranded-DNA-specific exonuclease